MLTKDKRRIGHMFGIWSRRIFSFAISALFVATLFSMPETGKAGHDFAVTDLEDSRLVGYWDLRDRDSFFQITNTSGSPIRIHIQLYDVSNGCFEINYFDTLTARDTHIYDVSNLDRNNGVAFAAPDLSGGHGIIGVSVVNADDSFDDNEVLTGNQRIIDVAGFEYRTNLAGISDADSDSERTVNFNGVDGSVFNDLVVIAVDTISSPIGSIVPVTEGYELVLMDTAENPVSCPNTVIGCAADATGGGFINVGINQAVTNSRGGPSLCLGTDPAGFLDILTAGETDNADAYIYFNGLNNNAGTGSMDSAIGDDNDEGSSNPG